MLLKTALLDASITLSRQVNAMEFSAPTHTVYNPLVYAEACYENYIERFADNPKKVVFLGMNPGPWGMAQVGIPFGEIAAVRDWMGIRGEIGKPLVEHPKRPIEGFACTRSEVSGRRLWGLMEDRFRSPESFFEDHFVMNYCPLVFMEESGRNRTPDKLPSAERESLYAACDEHLKRVIEVLSPEWLIGVGKFACTRAEQLFSKTDLKVDWILHPSPASPAANRDWSGYALKKMLQLGIWS